MHKFFLALYRFFARRRWLLYTLMALLFGVFGYFAVQVRYEEDVTKLVPGSDNAKTRLVGSNIKVKDKVIFQITSAPGDTLDPWTLAEYADTLKEMLIAGDSVSHHIVNILCRIDDDLPVNALYFLLDHVPSYVDTSCYAAMDSLLTPEVLAETMAHNYQLVMEDETGSKTEMVASDPAGLRTAVLGSLGGGIGAATGSYRMISSHLFCPDSSAVLLFLAPDFNYQESDKAAVLVNGIERSVKAFQAAHPDAEVLYHGTPVMSWSNASQMKKDIYLTVGISLLLVLIFIFVCFRDWKVIPYQLVPVVFGVLAALACIYWIKGGMSLMALGIGSVVLGVALSYCLHLITHFKYTGDPERVLREESTPVVLGCLTTIGAFLGLMATSSDLLRDFGLFATFGLVASTLFALVFLPHFFVPGDTRKNEKAFAVIDRINSVRLDRNRPLLWTVTLVAAVCVAFSWKVGFDPDLKNLNYIAPSAVRSADLFNEKNTGGEPTFYYAAVGETLDEALEGAERIVAVLEDLQAKDSVRRVGSMQLKLFVPTAVQQERIAAWNAYWTPERIAVARREIEAAARREGLDPAMFGGFFEMLRTPFEPASLYDSGIIPDELVSNFVEVGQDGSYMVFISANFDYADRVRIGKRVDALGGTLVLDPIFYTNDLVEIVHQDFNSVLWISSLFVLLVLLLSFRNIWLALLAFFPMFLSWYVVEGAMALLGIQFNLINIVISTFIFGIGVDYSIFVMQGLLDKARGGDGTLLLYHKSAIFFSAVVLMVVVTALLFAVHPAVASVGVSTIIGMVATILFTYTLQPFLFRQMLKVAYFRRSFKAAFRSQSF